MPIIESRQSYNHDHLYSQSLSWFITYVNTNLDSILYLNISLISNRIDYVYSDYTSHDSVLWSYYYLYNYSGSPWIVERILFEFVMDSDLYHFWNSLVS